MRLKGQLWYSLSRRGRFELLQDPNLVTRQAVEAEFDATVREDIEKFRAAATGFMAGELTDDEFRAQRLRRGVYSQRQPGVHMIRTKVPGGILTADQMDNLAEVSEVFADNKGHGEPAFGVAGR